MGAEQLLIRLAVELYYGPDVERCLRAADESVREAEASGAPAELARARNNAFITRWRPGREPELLALVDRMLSLPGLPPQVEAIGLMHRMMLLLAQSPIRLAHRRWSRQPFTVATPTGDGLWQRRDALASTLIRTR